MVTGPKSERNNKPSRSDARSPETKLARRYGVSRTTIYDRIRKGRLNVKEEIRPPYALPPQTINNIFLIRMLEDDACLILLRYGGSENILKMRRSVADRMASALGLNLEWNYWTGTRWEK